MALEVKAEDGLHCVCYAVDWCYLGVNLLRLVVYFWEKKSSGHVDLVAALYLFYPWEFSFTFNIDCLKKMVGTWYDFYIIINTYSVMLMSIFEWTTQIK